jgi:hypothetical protein
MFNVFPLQLYGGFSFNPSYVPSFFAIPSLTFLFKLFSLLFTIHNILDQLPEIEDTLLATFSSIPAFSLLYPNRVLLCIS